MNVITFDYDKSYINEATEKYLEEKQRYRLEEFAYSNAGLEFPSSLGWLENIWGAVIATGLICVAIFVLSHVPGVISTKREIRGREIGRALSAATKAGGYAADVATIVFLPALALFLVGGIALMFNDSSPTRPDKPDYRALLDQTVAENRNDFEEAVRLAADGAGIDLAEACENGKSRGPVQKRGDFNNKQGNHRLIQCGGDRFGTLLYADLEGGEFKSIGTSSGAETGKVIATSGHSAPTRNLSSVRFDGSRETRYKPGSDVLTGWAVDDGDDFENERPFAPEDEVTLEEAKSAESG
jgi:hypothetical protein